MSDGKLRIGIIGAGFIGRALAQLCVKNGIEVMISNSRGLHTLASTMSRCAAVSAVRKQQPSSVTW